LRSFASRPRRRAAGGLRTTSRSSSWCSIRRARSGVLDPACSIVFELEPGGVQEPAAARSGRAPVRARRVPRAVLLAVLIGAARIGRGAFAGSFTAPIAGGPLARRRAGTRVAASALDPKSSYQA